MKRLVAALVLALAVAPALAQTLSAPLPENATLLHLTEQAQRLVTRDQLRAELRVEAVDADAAKLQAEINRRMAAALARAKSVAGVTIETGGYSVYPQQSGPPIPRNPQWHGSTTLSLTAHDPVPLLALVGGLQQDGLVVSALAYELTPAAAKTVEGELTDEALTRLKERAERVAALLGLAVARLRDLRVGNAGGTQPLPRFRAEAALSSSPPPVAEPGQASVTVSVDADVVLMPRP
jgi:uncharacterized protein